MALRNNSPETREEPRFEDITCSLQSARRLPGGMIRETREAIAAAREFKHEVVRPGALPLDRRKQE